MKNIKEKIKLLKRKKEFDAFNKLLKINSNTINYLKNFYLNNKKKFIFLIIFFIFQGLFEVSIIMLSQYYFKAGAFLTYTINYSLLFILIVLLAILYLIFYYFSLKLGRTLIIYMINDLRRKWYKLFLNKSIDSKNTEAKGALIAKISYHLSLLNMGLSNSFFSFIRWLIFVFILVFLSFIFTWQLGVFVLLAIIFSLFIGFIAYFISKKYITKEATFYSQLIKFVDFSLSDWQFLKVHNREKYLLRDFDNIVELDTYFRIRRDLWLKFGQGIVFIVLIFLAFTFEIFNWEIQEFLSDVNRENRFIVIVFVIYFSRLIYTSLRAGLYSVPLFLGFSLSVPSNNPRPMKEKVAKRIDSLIFKSSKVKLYKKGKYYNNLEFKFNQGKRYLIYGKKRAGKTILAKLFCGYGFYRRSAWIIKANNERFLYNNFFSKYKGFYYIDPNFKSNRSILEFIAGKEKNKIKAEEFAKITYLTSKYKELKDVFFDKDDWRLSADFYMNNSKDSILLQILHCLHNKKEIIAVDNYWLDLNDIKINELLLLLNKEAKETILVLFSVSNNNIINYDKIYEI